MAYNNTFDFLCLLLNRKIEINVHSGQCDQKKIAKCL